MLPILLAFIVFFTDCLIAVFVFNALIRRGNPAAFPIAGMIILGGIVTAVMIWKYLPMGMNAG